MFALFKRPVRADGAVGPSTVLPQTVADAIDAAAINARFGEQDDEPRILITLPGLKPWLHTEDGAEKIFQGLFPELSERQLAKAIQRLRFRVAAAFKSASSDRLHHARTARVGGVNWGDDGRRW